MTLVAVNALVYDIRKYVPTATDTFVVDTNVWRWIAYTKMSLSAHPPPQATEYPTFIRLAKANGSALLHCGLSLSELSNIIERDEFRQYAASRGVAETDSERKKFRRDPWERGKVTAEIDAAWQQVRGLSTLATVVIDDQTTDACLQHLTKCMIDAYDGFIVEAAIKIGTPHIVTDDVDLCSVPGVSVFTSHPVVIASAAKAGKLKS